MIVDADADEAPLGIFVVLLWQRLHVYLAASVVWLIDRP
jgi:hypothetical protein